MKEGSEQSESLKTREQIIQELRSPFQNALNRGGINETFLIRQLKSEFRSKEPRIIKIKGSVRQEDLPKGYKVIANTAVIKKKKAEAEENGISITQTGDIEGAEDHEAEGMFLWGETIIEYQVKNIGISQKARMDVHKLRGDYPAEKNEVEITDKQAIAAIMESLPDKIRIQVAELVKEKLKAKKK